MKHTDKYRANVTKRSNLYLKSDFDELEDAR